MNRYCRANDVVYFKLVQTIGYERALSSALQRPLSSCRDLSSDKFQFKPVYTHQLFGIDEEIYGYRNLRVDIWFTAGSLFAYFNMSYDEMRDDADDVYALLIALAIV